MTEQAIKDLSLSIAAQTDTLKKIGERLTNVEEEQKQFQAALKSKSSTDELDGDGHVGHGAAKFNPSPIASGAAWLGRDGNNSHFINSFDSLSLNNYGGGAPDSAAEVNRAYTQIKDSLAKVKLPDELCLQVDSSGVKADSKPLLSVIRQSAGYIETTSRWISLKLGTNINENGNVELTEDEVKELFCIVYAHTRNLKSEYSAALVKGIASEEISKTFKIMEKNPTCFTDQQMKHIEFASQIASIKQQQQTPQQQPRPPRKSYGGFRPAGNQNQQQFQARQYGQNFQQRFHSKPFPPKRFHDAANQGGNAAGAGGNADTS